MFVDAVYAVEHIAEMPVAGAYKFHGSSIVALFVVKMIADNKNTKKSDIADYDNWRCVRL